MNGHNQQGVALLFVLTAITLLMAILADFTFETQINKLRSHNSQDQLQARLNAEAGLKLALIRLEIYQVVRNLIEKNKVPNGLARIQDLNQIWSIPFIYPLPVGKKAKLVVRAAIEKFMKNSLLEGEISTQIQNVSHLINLNLLRITRPNLNTSSGKDGRERDRDRDDGGGGEGNEERDGDRDEDRGRGDDGEGRERVGSSGRDIVKMILNLEARLVDLFRQKFDRRLEEEEEFARKYSNVMPEMLIKEIKFYINDVDKQLEPEIEEIRAQYASAEIQAKHAPFESLSELYLLKGWDDELVDMIKREVTVHGVVAIDLNQITEQGLKLLIPEMDDEQVKDFFEYRDDPAKPNFFNSIDEFKGYIVNTAHILSSSEMEQRIEAFVEAGIAFGVYGSLFQVISTGRYGRSEYTLNAFVEIPARPVARPAPKSREREIPRDSGRQERPGRPGENPDGNDRRNPPGRSRTQAPELPVPTQLLPPRVVEMTIY